MNGGTADHIVETYSQSLLDLAVQSEVVDAVERDLELVSTLLVQEPAFGAFLASPYFTERTKQDLVRKVLTDKLNRITFNFLSVVIDHDRGVLLPEIVDRYRQSCRALRGYTTVTATVAQPLNEQQVAKLTRDVATAMNAKVDLDVRVDPSILGGVIFRHGDRMLDNSVRGRLARTIGRITGLEKRHTSS